MAESWWTRWRRRPRPCGAGPRIPVSWRSCATTRCSGRLDHLPATTPYDELADAILNLLRGTAERKGMTDRPHMLYVAWGYPPCRGGGVYRALATANRFAALGWKVTVLTADRETFHRFTGADLTLEERIDPSIEVVRVPFEWPILEADLRKWSKRPGLEPEAVEQVADQAGPDPVPGDRVRAVALDHREGRGADPPGAQGRPDGRHREPARRVHRGVPPAQEARRAST